MSTVFEVPRRQWGPPTPGIDEGGTALTFYGVPDDLEGLTDLDEVSTGHSAEYVPINGMVWEPGSTAFGCAEVGGFVYVGVLNASTNSLNYSYINSTLHAFRPATREWNRITLHTDEGLIGSQGVVGSSGKGTGDFPGLVRTGNKVVALAVWDYSDWVIGTFGRYPAWVEFDGLEIDYAASKTVEQLQDDAVDGDGELSFPNLTNAHAETYASNRGMANEDVLPNGRIVAIDYFAVSGLFSGRLKIFDETGNQRAFYQWPDMQTIDGVDLQMAPKFISVDPSSTDPTDYRMVVNFDVFVRSTSTARPFMVQEMSYNSTNGNIEPVCAPVASASRDETANFSDYTGQQTARPVFSRDGTCWVPAGQRGTFTQKPMGVWLKSGGERRWAAENPPTAGWEDRLGENRLVSDFELGALEAANQLHSGEYIDERSNGHLTVGFLGGLFPFIADDPLVLRSVFIANPTFASNVTSWSSFGATGGIAHEATDGGRLKFTGNGSAANGVFQSPAGSAFTDLPANSEGQSLWAWVRVKAGATSRVIEAEISFHESDDTHIVSITGPLSFDNTSDYVKVAVAAEVPEGATKIVLYVRIVSGGANGEVHVADEAHCSIAPVTHLPAADLDLTSLPKNTADVRWPAGSSSRTAVDAKRRGWLPITCLENGATVQPSPMPQYLVKLNMPELLGLSQGYRPFRRRPVRVNVRTTVPFVPEVTDSRLTEDGDRRVLESGDDRLLEN